MPAVPGPVRLEPLRCKGKGVLAEVTRTQSLPLSDLILPFFSMNG